MCLKINLFILLIYATSYSSTTYNDSIVNTEKLLDFKTELNKFKDSVVEKNKPILYSKEYFKLDRNIIMENTDNLEKLYKLSTSNISNANNNNNNIEAFGSISRGITVGNNQNSVLNSELDLQISGKLNDKVSIKASIQDSNIPLQDNGYSQQLDEFDQIFIEISSDKWNIRGGDIDLSEDGTFYGNFQKRIQGLYVKSKLKNSITTETAGAIVKGKYKKTEIITQNGNQGPYKLIGENGELYVLVVSGSESVFVNGKKINRGIDEDYVINYNAGEIIFNSTFPIMADMRIQVEYQVSEKNFSSFIGFAKAEVKMKNSTHKLSFFNENDLKNQPLLQNLSNNQIEILTDAGDNNDQMYAPTGLTTSYNENRILYKKVIINNIEIFVYSNNPEDVLYDVTFSNVGENQGDYVILTNNAIDNIYEYVQPINGQKQGNFDPKIKLIAPKKLQLIVFNSTFHTKNNSNFNFEVAGSKKDNNLFSLIDDNDNKGFASKVNYKIVKEINNNDINAEIDINYINKNFQTVERIYNVEFNRDWDFSSLETSNYNQLFSNANIEFENKKLGSIVYNFENLNFENFYKGIKNGIILNSNENKNFIISSKSSIMNSNRDEYESEFISSFNSMNYNYKTGWAKIVYNYERKTSSFNAPNIINPDFGYQFLELKKGFGNNDKSFIEFGYKRIINDSVKNLELEKVNYSNSYFLNSQIINDKSKINLFINQNNLITFENNSKEKFLNTKLIYNQKVIKNILDSNLYYETNSGNLPQQEYTYLEVEPGLGSYKWIDINENNIQELEEFEIAVFEDEGKYIRVLLPNQIFIRTYQNKFNYSANLNFLSWKNSNEKIKRFISRISNQFQYSLDKKNNLDINPEIELNPFSVNESNLLAYNYALKNIIYLNKSKQKYSIAFTYAENDTKNNYSFGSTKSKINFKRINFIHKINDLFLFELIRNSEKKSSWSQNFMDRNYRLNDDSIDTKLTYITGIDSRLNFLYKTTDIKNYIGSKEKLNQQNFGVSLFLNEKQNSSFFSEFNYFKNQFTGNTNSIISYVMMNGLQNGENYTWSLKFQKKISKLLDLNLIYVGRKSENNMAIHNGSIQLKAIF